MYWHTLETIPVAFNLMSRDLFLWVRHCYYPYFIDQEMKLDRLNSFQKAMDLTYSRAGIQTHGWWVQHSNCSHFTILLGKITESGEIMESAKIRYLRLIEQIGFLCLIIFSALTFWSFRVRTSHLLYFQLFFFFLSF